MLRYVRRICGKNVDTGVYVGSLFGKKCVRMFQATEDTTLTLVDSYGIEIYAYSQIPERYKHED